MKIVRFAGSSSPYWIRSKSIGNTAVLFSERTDLNCSVESGCVMEVYREFTPSLPAIVGNVVADKSRQPPSKPLLILLLASQ
jgi:hypothetical protein